MSYGSSQTRSALFGRSISPRTRHACIGVCASITEMMRWLTLRHRMRLPKPLPDISQARSVRSIRWSRPRSAPTCNGQSGRHCAVSRPAPPRPMGSSPKNSVSTTPRAAIDVGAAIGANPIAIIVPCHRVIASNGELRGYAWGLNRKRWLLEHENAIASALEAPQPMRLPGF